MGDKGIVFKNRVGLYEKELEVANEKFVKQVMEINAGEVKVNVAQEKLNKKSIETINAGLVGANQQLRDAQLALLCTEERDAVNSASLELAVIKHSLEITASNLNVAKLNMQFINAAMNATFVVSCIPDKALDEEAKAFADKFKA